MKRGFRDDDVADVNRHQQIQRDFDRLFDDLCLRKSKVRTEQAISKPELEPGSPLNRLKPGSPLNRHKSFGSVTADLASKDHTVLTTNDIKKVQNKTNVQCNPLVTSITCDRNDAKTVSNERNKKHQTKPIHLATKATSVQSGTKLETYKFHSAQNQEIVPNVGHRESKARTSLAGGAGYDSDQSDRSGVCYRRTQSSSCNAPKAERRKKHDTKYTVDKSAKQSAAPTPSNVDVSSSCYATAHISAKTCVSSSPLMSLGALKMPVIPASRRVTGSPFCLKMSGSEVSPKMSGSEVPPKMSGSEVPPKMSGSEVPPKMSGSEVPPKMSGSEVSPKMSRSPRMSISPGSHRVPSFPSSPRMPISPKVTSSSHRCALSSVFTAEKSLSVKVSTSPQRMLGRLILGQHSMNSHEKVQLWREKNADFQPNLTTDDEPFQNEDQPSAEKVLESEISVELKVKEKARHITSPEKVSGKGRRSCLTLHRSESDMLSGVGQPVVECRPLMITDAKSSPRQLRSMEVQSTTSKAETDRVLSKAETVADRVLSVADGTAPQSADLTFSIAPGDPNLNLKSPRKLNVETTKIVPSPKMASTLESAAGDTSDSGIACTSTDSLGVHVKDVVEQVVVVENGYDSDCSAKSGVAYRGAVPRSSVQEKVTSKHQKKVKLTATTDPSKPRKITRPNPSQKGTSTTSQITSVSPYQCKNKLESQSKNSSKSIGRMRRVRGAACSATDKCVDTALNAVVTLKRKSDANPDTRTKRQRTVVKDLTVKPVQQTIMSTQGKRTKGTDKRLPRVASKLQPQPVRTVAVRQTTVPETPPGETDALYSLQQLDNGTHRDVHGSLCIDIFVDKPVAGRQTRTSQGLDNLFRSGAHVGGLWQTIFQETS